MGNGNEKRGLTIWFHGRDTYRHLNLKELLDELRQAHQAVADMKEAERGLALYARRRGASYGQIAHARGGSSNSYHANWTYVCRVNGGPPAEPDLAEAAPDDPRQP